MNLTVAVLDALWKLLGIAGALGLVVWLIRRQPRVTGQPTPDSARVVIEAAKQSQVETQAAVKEVDHASPDDLVRRVEQLRARGRAGK